MNLFLMVSGHRWENQERGNNVIQCFRNEGLTAPTTKKKKHNKETKTNLNGYIPLPDLIAQSYCLLPTTSVPHSLA